jgi:type VI secretion system secreted protein Hcp
MANMFMEISDIPGDTPEVNHTNWITLQSVNWGLQRAVDINDAGSSNQRGHANANFNKVEVNTELGQAACRLMLSVANGTIRPEIKIHQCRSGELEEEGLKPYLITTIFDTQIDSYSVSCSEDAVPTETWTLAYTRIQWEYYATDQTNMALTKVNEFKWNLRTGKVG